MNYPLVKTITGITPDNITDDILNSEQPLLLKGFSSEWQLVKKAKVSAKLAAEYLKQYDSGRPINLCQLDSVYQGRVFYNQDMSGFNFTNKTVGLSEAIDDIFKQPHQENPKGLYVGSTGLKSLLPNLASQMQVNHIPEGALVNIWLGNQSKIAAHYDASQNLACCVVGHRRFTLFPPEQGPNLYVGPLDKAPGGQAISLVDLDDVDDEQFPKFKNALAHCQVAELSAGDALILPSMWWHHVSGLSDFNVLVSHWWSHSPKYLARPHTALLHAILSIRDLPQNQREAWRNLFEQYVFDFEAQEYGHIPEQEKGLLKSPLDEMQTRRLRAELINKLKR